MKKRLLSCLIVMAMLISTVYLPVFASVGRIDGDDVVKFYDNANSAANIEVTGNCLSAENGVFVYNSGQGTVQSRFKGFTTDAANDGKDTYGALSFKINADAANTNESAITFILGGLTTSNGANPVQIHPFKMTTTGYMGMGEEGSYNQSATDGMAYTKGQWYTVGIVFNKNNTFDYYIDGKYQRNVKFDAGKEWDQTATLAYLFANTTKGKFYLDDLTWSSYSEDGFNAEGNKAVASKGETLTVAFTEPVAAYDLNAIKLYECETGAEVTGAQYSFENNILSVTLPEGLSEGKEYRIELNNITGALGKQLCTDNIYFNSPLKGEEKTDIVASDDFKNYTGKTDSDKIGGASSSINFYKLNGWYLNKKWINNEAEKNSYIQPTTDADSAHGQVLNIKQTAQSNTGTTAYLPIGSDINTGKVNIKFDVKAETLGVDKESTYKEANLQLLVYPDGIDSADKSWGNGDSTSIGQITGTTYGRVVTGIYNNILINPSVQINNKRWSTADWKEMKTYTIGTADAVTSPEWVSVEVVLDFDKGTVDYIVDGTTHSGAANLSTLGIDGIQGISFGAPFTAANTSVYIDNVSVEHTYIANMKTDDIKSETFSNYVTEGVWHDDGNNYYYLDGWYLFDRYTNRFDSFIRPVTDDEAHGTVAQIGQKVSDSEKSETWSDNHIYLPLGKKVSEGTLTITYDMKPERYQETKITDTTKLPNLYLSAYANELPEDDKSYLHNGSSMIGAYSDGNARVISGVIGKELGHPTGDAHTDRTKWVAHKTFNTNADNTVTEADKMWYTVKVEMNFDTGAMTYYLDGDVVGETTGVMDTLGLADGVSGISFGTQFHAQDASTLIDNVTVQHTYNDVASSGGVMQVRFSDYYLNSYGTATTQSTLVETIGISFWSKNIDPDSVNVNTVQLINTQGNTAVEYEPQFDEENDIYMMNLKEYMTENSSYTLIVDGVTAGGNSIQRYEQIIATDEDGELIIEPVYIKHNDVQAEEGTLAENDTLTSSLRVINTTGEKESFALSMAVYDGDILTDFDFEEFELDGITTKSADVEVGFKLDATDAENTTSARVFLWDGMTSMKPLGTFGEFVGK